jgi:hypothetical protein
VRLAWASLLVLMSVGGADTAGLAVRSTLVRHATLPPQLQALEQKMQRLRVNSERYTHTSRGLITVVNETNGQPVGHEKSVSLDENISGEVSISPPQAEVIDVNTGKPIQIQIGSTEYIYSREIARKHPGRAWIRRNGAGSSALLDYGSPLEVFASPGDASVGGEGSYAQLFNLLTTAVGSVAVRGPISIDGQATTEFTAEVEPLRLIRGLTVEDLRNLKKHPVITELTLFLSEAGFPLRVALSQSARHAHFTETTNITAVEVPLSIAPPPPGETIGVTARRAA